MECSCLSYRELPHTTKLFASYIYDFPQVSRWYSHDPDEAGVLESAAEIRMDPTIRGEVVDILREQNRAFGIDGAVEQNLARLANGAAAIVTGQQVGLFGGPAYSIYKAAGVLRWAEHLTERGKDAVPVFWLATEDHDFAEVNHTFFKGGAGLSELALEIPPEFEGRSVGEIALPKEIGQVVEKAAGQLEGSYSEEACRALKESYHPGENFGSAFGKLMARLFAGRGLILIEPLDSRLHRLASSVYRRAIENNDSIQADLLERSKELESAGYHAQVRTSREGSLMFVEVEGKREPVRSRGGKFTAGRRTFSRDELLQMAQESPELFSANVLLRPVVQDTLLPTAAYIAGPAEIAYYAQAERVYGALLGRMPAILPRSSITLVEPALARILKKYRMDAREVLLGRQNLRAKLALHALPGGLMKRFERDEKALWRLLQGYRKPLGQLDKTLVGAIDTAERKMLYQFTKLRAKAGRAENGRAGILDRHEGLLLDALCPHRALQERTLNFLPFLSQYGSNLLDQISEHSGPTCPDHKICFL
jgi:bacillithiol synthase